MPEYRVKWEIDMQAETPDDAAAMALIVMRDNDPANMATVFKVENQMTGSSFTVDLSRTEG